MPRAWPSSEMRTVAISIARLAAVSGLVAVAMLGSGSATYARPSGECVPCEGVLEVAPAGAVPLVWYDASNPPPPLTDQISELAGSLRPGDRGTMTAYVRNTAGTAGVPNLSIADITGSPALADAIEATVTYSSSLSPAVVHTVAVGTLEDLASHGPYPAPIRLYPSTRRCTDIGTWSITVELPEDAGNEVQGLLCTCSVRFGIVGCRK
ncbi:MAG: hypothetical protein ACYCX5_03865 [Coriobacteriia bacterium]